VADGYLSDESDLTASP